MQDKYCLSKIKIGMAQFFQNKRSNSGAYVIDGVDNEDNVRALLEVTSNNEFELTNEFFDNINMSDIVTAQELMDNVINYNSTGIEEEQLLDEMYLCECIKNDVMQIDSALLPSTEELF